MQDVYTVLTLHYIVGIKLENKIRETSNIQSSNIDITTIVYYQLL